MVFSSLPFLFAFLPATLLIYFIAPKKIKNIALLIASLIFYAWGEPVYVSLMILSSIVDYTAGRLMEKYSSNKTKKRVVIICSIVFNLSLLCFFKYSGFFVENFYSAFGVGMKTFHIALPIGISFFIFQTMSYSIDVYRGDIKTEHNYLNYITYVSMFPQLIAGPIVRYKTIKEELQSRTITLEHFTQGFTRFIVGLGKKVLLANNVGLLFKTIMNTSQNSVVLSWVALIAFSFQIYFDFSGYSDMAIGLGRMLGFTFNENFNFPYISKNITEFWRRWHISLSTFFKDYVYIPMGGNRKGIVRSIFNLLFVWLLTGFWHGASWNFILWGVYYGIIIVFEKFVLKKYLDKLPAAIQHLYSIFLILIGWMIFAFEDFNMLKNFASGLFGFGSLPILNTYTLYILKNYLMILIGCSVFSTPFVKNISDKISKASKALQISAETIRVCLYLCIFILSVAYLVDDTYNPFLYFRF